MLFTKCAIEIYNTEGLIQELMALFLRILLDGQELQYCE
jgi:hypothetical protein